MGGMQKMQKLQQSKKVPENGLSEPPFRCVYLISSTSTQKENPVASFLPRMKIRCAKYKFAKQSDIILMQSLVQLLFGDLWDLDKL